MCNAPGRRAAARSDWFHVTVATRVTLIGFTRATMPGDSPRVVAFIAVMAVSLAGSRVAVDPPRGSHCDCAGGLCPLDSNGRSCSCGCAKRADAQPAARLESQPAVSCTDGMAGPYPCRDIDLMAFLPHGEIGGGSGNDIWGWTDPLTGREYALVGRSTGTAFVDISNPSQPIYVGNLPTHTAASPWRGIKVFANHAFIVSEAIDHGMQVFDLTQLRDVTAPPVTFPETAHYAGFGSTHTLAVNERTGFAYAAGTRTCEGGLHVVDVRTPASPRAAGCFSFDGYSHETQCVVYEGPDTLYRDREICFNSNEDTLTIVDVSDKLEQLQLSRTGYGGSAYTHQGWLTEDQRFFLVNDEGDEQAFRHQTRTWIWDVSDLDAPVIANYYDGPTSSIDHNLYVRGNLVYESNYRSGLRVLDASDIAAGRAARGRVLRHLSKRRQPGVQRRVDVVSVLCQRVGDHQRHRAGPVRRPAAADPAGPSRRPVGHDRRTRKCRARAGPVVRRPDRKPGTRSALADSGDRNAAGNRAAPVRAHIPGFVRGDDGRDLRDRQPGTRRQTRS